MDGPLGPKDPNHRRRLFSGGFGRVSPPSGNRKVFIQWLVLAFLDAHSCIKCRYGDVTIDIKTNEIYIYIYIGRGSRLCFKWGSTKGAYSLKEIHNAQLGGWGRKGTYTSKRKTTNHTLCEQIEVWLLFQAYFTLQLAIITILIILNLYLYCSKIAGLTQSECLRTRLTSCRYACKFVVLGLHLCSIEKEQLQLLGPQIREVGENKKRTTQLIGIYHMKIGQIYIYIY